MDYEGSYFLGYILRKDDASRTAQVQCLNAMLGVMEPQELEPDYNAVVYGEEKLFVAPCKPKAVQVSRRKYKYVYE